MVREAARFIGSDEGALLAAANKRITNILKKSGFEVPFGISPRDLAQAPDARLFQQDEEHALLAGLRAAGESALQLRDERRYAESLAALLPLSAPTTAFFDKVMVNVDDPAVRDNRITLLQHARAYMNLVADLTLMAG
jgi:glycyl-tRNA synthetase beta chain